MVVVVVVVDGLFGEKGGTNTISTEPSDKEMASMDQLVGRSKEEEEELLAFTEFASNNLSISSFFVPLVD
jgi:hypothetical protein